MKDARLRTRSLIAGLSLLLIASFSVKAEESPLLDNIHAFRISNFIGLNAFYQFSANGATDILNEVVESINSANSALNTVNESGTDVLNSDQLGELTTEFDKFKNLMRQNINDVRKNGYPDIRMMSELADQAQALGDISTELYASARESSETDTDDRVEAARSAAVLMAQMMSKYSARSNSSVAQTFQGAATATPLDKQAVEFDQLMDRLNAGSASGELKKTIDSVSSKWQFIRGSYVNYNDDNVPFIIDRYSKGILDGLANTIAMLRKTA
ncbi:hypothetical protein [Marinobacter caseinilyticus]|uniref:hypothetical protein n=1 Tax=Marinobacter caseinilyticus TaxID=2692195 RepID=UPI00140C34E1|nr:hypothetical protein [Marinobacter caseinilyticus]